MPCSIWMPPWASGPVLTVSRPILNGAACAIAGMAIAVAAAAPAAVLARNLRRLMRMGMGQSSLVHPLAGLFVRGIRRGSNTVIRQDIP